MNTQHFNISKKSKYTLLDSIYFTSVVHTSTGFGDIYPISNTTKLITTLHIICVFVSLASVVILKDNIKTK